MNKQNNFLTVTNSKGFETIITSGKHTWRSDEPLDAGGTDTGPTPYDILLSALGSCKAITMRMYSLRKNFSVDAITIKLHHNKIYAEDCDDCETKVGKIDIVNVEISFTGNLTDGEKKRLLEIAEKCPVHKTLVSEIKINTKLENKILI